MAFTPFVETDQPTMAEFNEKFQECIQEAVAEAISAGVKVATGSYVGTTTSGGSYVNLNFPFKPKLLLIISPRYKAQLYYALYPVTSYSYYWNGNVHDDGSITWGENNISLYTLYLNYNGSTYYYAAFGWEE